MPSRGWGLTRLTRSMHVTYTPAVVPGTVTVQSVAVYSRLDPLYHITRLDHGSAAGRLYMYDRRPRYHLVPLSIESGESLDRAREVSRSSCRMTFSTQRSLDIHVITSCA